MAKILCNYFGLSMAAEGKSEFVGRQAAAFLGYVQQDAERCAENCGRAEDLSDAPEEIKREILRNDEELRRRKQTAPGVEHDVVAIYDNAGIPSIMHRFRRVTNKELFGGSDAVHPAFIIGGEVYDEIYISVYENTMINGKPYSLPLQEPVTNITIFKSITFDNGTEFAAAEELERSCINKHLPRTKVYFCHPYSSWERGTNENTNGMIRRRFPKGTNFAAVTNAQIAQAENWINNYPRKILGYRSSEIVFRECLRELGIAA